MSSVAPARVRPSLPAGRFLRFFLIALGIAGAVHFYFWLRLVHDTRLPQPWFAIASAALVALAVSMPLSFIVRRKRPELVWPAQVWMGTLLLLFTSLLAADVVRGVLGLAGHPAAPRALEGAAGGAALALAGVAVAYARRMVVRTVEVRIAKLPRELDGFAIVQITDLHIGGTIGKKLVEDVVERTNALAPDLIAVTGDLADGDPAKLRDAASPLGRLKAKHGILFVTGNHEYFGDVHGWLSLVRELGMQPLRNERVAIGALDVAGIDDTMGAWTPGHGPDLPRALAGRDPSRPLLLLAHRPTAAVEASRHGVDLVLSGHTHAGQIWPFKYLVRLDSPFLEGLYTIGNTKLWVSAGTGWWGPPMRLGTTREISRIVLRAA